MQPVFKAEAEGFIWLIVGIFWVVAQIAGGAAKKKAPPRRPVEPNRDGEKPAAPTDVFAELMQRLTGAEELEAPKPQWQPAEELEEIDASWGADEVDALPDLEPAERMAPAPIEPLEPIEVTEADFLPKMSQFRSAMPSIRMPAMDLNFQTPEKSGGKNPIIGNIINPADKKSLRRAMLGNIILSAPKALERNP